MIREVHNEQFQEILSERLKKIEEILGKKALEYVRNEDRLHNFNVASRIRNVSREEALWGMAMKHLVSVMDIINDTKIEKYPTIEMVDEKFGDLINYLILAEVSLKHNIFRNNALKVKTAIENDRGERVSENGKYNL